MPNFELKEPETVVSWWWWSPLKSHAGCGPEKSTVDEQAAIMSEQEGAEG